MNDLIKNIVKEYLAANIIKEKMVGYLVKKNKRGTYQALQECTKLEEQLAEDITLYLVDWLTQELLTGKFNKEVQSELLSQLTLELGRLGFKILDPG